MFEYRYSIFIKVTRNMLRMKVPNRSQNFDMKSPDNNLRDSLQIIKDDKPIVC